MGPKRGLWCPRPVLTSLAGTTQVPQVVGPCWLQGRADADSTTSRSRKGTPRRQQEAREGTAAEGLWSGARQKPRGLLCDAAALQGQGCQATQPSRPRMGKDTDPSGSSPGWAGGRGCSQRGRAPQTGFTPRPASVTAHRLCAQGNPSPSVYGVCVCTCARVCVRAWRGWAGTGRGPRPGSYLSIKLTEPVGLCGEAAPGAAVRAVAQGPRRPAWAPRGPAPKVTWLLADRAADPRGWGDP